MARWLAWIGFTSFALALGGCPGPAPSQDAARSIPTTANVQTGNYGGEETCTGRTQGTGDFILPGFEQTNQAALNVVIGADGVIQRDGQTIAVGVELTGSGDGASAVQKITEIVRVEDGILVKYTSGYTLDVLGRRVELTGGGQFKIGAIDDNSILYIEDGTVAYSDSKGGFTSSVSCTAILRK